MATRLAREFYNPTSISVFERKSAASKASNSVVNCLMNIEVLVIKLMFLQTEWVTK